VPTLALDGDEAVGSGLKCPTGKSTKTCPALFREIFRLTRRANHLYNFAPFHPREEGRFAIVTNVGLECGGRGGGARRAALGADGEVVWS
jgi:hypothetical protein